MNPEKFEHYLANVHLIAKKAKEDRSELKNLFQWIDQYRQDSSEDPEYETFFKGEFYFYRGNYEQALKYYLEAKSIPHFPFFCYRASGYISLFRNDKEKALQFAEKAMEILPEDISIDALIEKATQSSNESTLSLSDRELQELEQIFEEKDAESELFSQEFSSSSNTALKVSGSAVEVQNQTLVKEEEKASNLKAAHEIESLDLDEKTDLFQKAQTAAVKNYLDEKLNRHSIQENCFYFLQGNMCRSCPIAPDLDLIAPRGRAITGGFFLRWNQKGIAINPGKGFLREFHNQGLHLHHLDAIIITKSQPESYADIEDIYALNARLNQNALEPHVIHYYLNPNAYQELSPVLKPHFKQERRSLHPLEFFVDSPDVEKVEIGQGIALHYFPLGNITSDVKDKSTTSLGIRLDLTSEETHHVACRLGYISGAPWSPIIPHHLGHCDLLIAGFGVSKPKGHDVDQNLGYYGTFSLMEEAAPRLMILAEVNGKEGDIRLESAKKIRHDFSHSQTSFQHPPVIIPGDLGLLINLNTLSIFCGISNEWLTPQEVSVVKTKEAFGKLQYVSPACFL